MPKLTKRFVDSLKPVQEREVLVWDEIVKGFGLRIYPGGAKGYFVQYRAKGRTRRLALGRHGVLTADQARRLAQDALARVRAGADPAEDRRRAAQGSTVAELAERYLTEHARTKKKRSSAETDARNLRLHVLPRLGRRLAADVSRADLSALRHAMRATPGAANRVLALVSKMFSLAERWGLRPDGSNPARHIERFPERKMQRFLSARELARLGDVLTEMERSGTEPLETVAAVRILILTGARRGEILGLEWQHVDLDAACLRLPDSKEGGAKLIPLGTHAIGALARLPRRSRWVLPTVAGDGPVSLSKPWSRMRRRAGLDDVRLHDLRHSFASVGVAGGDSLFIVGSILGHKRASTTERYAHLSDDPRRAAMERIGARIVCLRFEGSVCAGHLASCRAGCTRLAMIACSSPGRRS